MSLQTDPNNKILDDKLKSSPKAKANEVENNNKKEDLTFHSKRKNADIDALKSKIFEGTLPSTIGSSRFSRPRKLSFPSTSIRHQQINQGLQGNGLTDVSGGGFSGVSGTGVVSNLELPEVANRRIRRFSNVSDAVSRKLSTTIGWRTVSVQDIVTQAKSLAGQYIRCRLKRSGVLTKKMGSLQRLRSLTSLHNLGSSETTGSNGANVGAAHLERMNNEIFLQLQAIAHELERLHPKIYSGVSRQVSITITGEKTVRSILSSVSRELFKSDISWGKIVSLFCVVGGLSVECVKLGHPEYLLCLVEVVGVVVERDAANWIAQQGGWTALLSRYRQPDEDHGVFQMIALSVVCLIFILVAIVFLLRAVGKVALRLKWSPDSEETTSSFGHYEL